MVRPYTSSCIPLPKFLRSPERGKQPAGLIRKPTFGRRQGKQFGLHGSRLLWCENQCSHSDATQFLALPIGAHYSHGPVSIRPQEQVPDLMRHDVAEDPREASVPIFV